MAAMRGPRLQVGSAAWVAEERNAALQITQSEVDEFSYSARNELDWLNEHMAGIFNENEMNLAETFKTPAKLRGKTPRTARKANPLETRVPLSEVFSATPNGASSPINRLQSPRLKDHVARGSPTPSRASPARVAVFSAKPATQGTQDSGYFGSQDVAPMNIHMDSDFEDEQETPQRDDLPTTTIPTKNSPTRTVAQDSTEKTFRTAKEEQTTRVLADASQQMKVDTQFDHLEHESPYADDVSPERQLSLEAKQSARYPDDARSASDASSPIRPVVRKSSLNFASLPAREPLTAGKSNGARVSQTSHLDHIRTSYYNRPTGGKSLGEALAKIDQDEIQEDEMDMDDDALPAQSAAIQDTKTYTQRLQDQINMLGQTQVKNTQILHSRTTAQKSASPIPLNTLQSTPGAFPEDDDDDWIEPPATVLVANDERPNLPKSHSADVMEGIQGKRTIGQTDFVVSDEETVETEPQNGQLDKTYVSKIVYGHGKSASVPVIPGVRSTMDDARPLKKVVSVSNPSLMTVAEANALDTPSKSPSRAFRESPLKQVKNKLSSILKSSRGLLASSAAISAEGKSLMSPSSVRLGLHSFMSSESVVSQQHTALQGSQSVAANQDASPTRPTRRTRASVEKEKVEKKREKEAKRLEEQNEKLEKARQKEREKARVFSKEQEKIAAMEKQMASKKEGDRPTVKETPKPTRTGLRNATDSGEETTSLDRDTEMEDALSMPPPSAPRPTHATRNKELKRPLKPTRETQTRPKQAPTVIRVNTGSQHPQYRLSTAQTEPPSLAAAQVQHSLASRASKASLQPKPSTQSLRGTAASSRAKAQELAAKKKELEEREAQKRRDAKAEMDRKKIAALEEQRKQELKRQEAERQRVQQQQQQQQQQQEQAAMQSQTQTKSTAQRKAAIEKAKQTRAPPPAVRSQPNGPPDFAMGQDSQTARPQSRMTSNAHWNQEESGRPVNAVLSNASKAGAKRTLTQEKGDDSQAMRPQSRGGPAYQANEAKRRRTSEAPNDETDTSGSQRNIRGPPVRPSAAFKKELPPKSVFQSGYGNASQSTTRDLFKATVTAQHTSQTKAAHPLEMAQISKGAIPFAPNPNAAGPAYKTPARPGPVNAAKSTAKSVPRSSPRFQNGEAIELPEIQTDDDSEDDEANGVAVAPWADSPDLRRALMNQETMDPSEIFGPPRPLNMEEVFSKNKDRWHKFRPRTSSANWSGGDRLTEDDIRKDLAARDKLRRDGGWSYEMSKDML